MKNRLIGLLATCMVTLSACASLPKFPPRTPDGRIDTDKLLQWAEDGIRADCLIQGAEADVCVFGLPAVQALEHHDPAYVRAGLVALMARLPHTVAWVQWVVAALPAAPPA